MSLRVALGLGLGSYLSLEMLGHPVGHALIVPGLPGLSRSASEGRVGMSVTTVFK
jgi:hypothetical protein